MGGASRSRIFCGKIVCHTEIDNLLLSLKTDKPSEGGNWIQIIDINNIGFGGLNIWISVHSYFRMWDLVKCEFSSMWWGTISHVIFLRNVSESATDILSPSDWYVPPQLGLCRLVAWQLVVHLTFKIRPRSAPRCPADKGDFCEKSQSYYIH